MDTYTTGGRTLTDNIKMWTDLEMDIETHDLLCEALPIAFGDIYIADLARKVIDIAK